MNAVITTTNYTEETRRLAETKKKTTTQTHKIQISEGRRGRRMIVKWPSVSRELEKCLEKRTAERTATPGEAGSAEDGVIMCMCVCRSAREGNSHSRMCIAV